MTSILKVNQIQTTAGAVPTAADLGLNVTGSVLQVVQTEYSTPTIHSTGSGTLTTIFSGSITPKQANSKILIQVTVNLQTAVNQDGVFIGLKRNSTAIARGQSSGNRTSVFIGGGGSGVYQPQGHAMSYLDTPNSNSTIQYSVVANKRNGGNLVVNYSENDPDQADRARGLSTMILMEIAG